MLIETSVRAAALPALRRFARRLTDLVLPPQCLICRALVSDPAALCASCWRELFAIGEPCCARLGTPFAFDEGEGAVSAAAIAEPPVWNAARAAVAYDDHSASLVHALKYADRHEAALLMQRMMRHAGRLLLAQADLVVPVPLHRRRLWSRRYNQSALLAQPLARGSAKRYFPEALERVKSTPRQVGLSREQRDLNVRRAFAVPDRARPEVLGRRILLIDDVITTGATANACAAVLKKAGAAEVNVLAFALVLEPKHLHI